MHYAEVPDYAPVVLPLKGAFAYRPRPRGGGPGPCSVPSRAHLSRFFCLYRHRLRIRGCGERRRKRERGAVHCAGRAYFWTLICFHLP